MSYFWKLNQLVNSSFYILFFLDYAHIQGT